MPLKSRPEFETVEEMLNWAGLYRMTQRTLVEELVVARLSSKLIRELVTVRNFFSLYVNFHNLVLYHALYLLQLLAKAFICSEPWYLCFFALEC